MNRQQRRLIQFPKGAKQKPRPPQPPKQQKTIITNDNSQEILDSLEPAQLVGGINKLITDLRRAGIVIYDWDRPGKSLFKIQRIKGKFYYLADEEKPPEADGDQAGIKED